MLKERYMDPNSGGGHPNKLPHKTHITDYQTHILSINIVFSSQQK